MKTIDFEKVCDFARYNICGDVDFLTPFEFSKLSEQEKFDFYRKVFDNHMNLCVYLTANLKIAKLENNYAI